MLSCDNLPNNGATTKRVTTQFAALRDPDLAKWIDDNVAFPSTMVDRIVPATTDEDRRRVSARLSVADAWPVVTEPFFQWVVEDRFNSGRPRLEDSGATFVATSPHSNWRSSVYSTQRTRRSPISVISLASRHCPR